MFRLVAAAVLVLPLSAQAWGYRGHTKLAELMQDALPADHCLRAWFEARNTTELQNLAFAPDQWKDNDAGEWTRHYLQIDRASPAADYPRRWEDVVAWRPQHAVGNGQVPWHVEQRYRQLVQAFESKNQTTILNEAFVLSHYVFDAMSVLHDTQHFDTPNGVHERWESRIFNDSEARVNGVTATALTHLGTPGLVDPRNATFDLILVGNSLYPQLVTADQASANIPELYDNTRDLTARRWADGITLMSSILWTAWNEAGHPELTGFDASCSRALPQAELVVNGFPPPDGWTHEPDAGEGDAGVEAPDAGEGGGAGGEGGSDGGLWWTGGGGGGGSGGGGDGPESCTCSSGATVLVLLGAFLARRRRNAQPLS